MMADIVYQLNMTSSNLRNKPLGLTVRVLKSLTKEGRLALIMWLHFMLYGPILKASRERVILCILPVGKM